MTAGDLVLRVRQWRCRRREQRYWSEVDRLAARGVKVGVVPFDWHTRSGCTCGRRPITSVTKTIRSNAMGQSTRDRYVVAFPPGEGPVGPLSEYAEAFDQFAYITDDLADAQRYQREHGGSRTQVYRLVPVEKP